MDIFPGEYWIGDLSFILDEYFDEHLHMVEGIYKTRKGNIFARFCTGSDGIILIMKEITLELM